MEKYRIVDAHVHTYPTASLGRQAKQGSGLPGCSGTLEELAAVMARGNISHAVMANMTPTYDMKMSALKNLPPRLTPEEREKAEREVDARMIDRLKRRNFWTCAAAKDHPSLIPLIGIDVSQTPSDMKGEIKDEAQAHGAKGLKLHPVANRFYPYDQRLLPAYATALEMGLPILFHSGEAEVAGYKEADYGRPKNFEPVLKQFPGLTVILAHLAKGFFEELMEIAPRYNNLYFDTSAILTGREIEKGVYSRSQVTQWIRTLGASRVLFGSDWPWYDPLLAIEEIKSLNLEQDEKKRILGQNAQRIFGL